MARAKKKEKEETEKLIPSLLPTSTTDEVDTEEEVAEQAEPAKFQILKYLGPVLLGLFTFIFGLIFFFSTKVRNSTSETLMLPFGGI